jgi:hypothetical protein
MTIQWVHPFTCVLAGPTQCGKSTWVKKFLTHLDAMVDTKFQEIVFCYGVAQKAHAELQGLVNVPLRLVEGMPEADEIANMHTGPKLLILDDLVSQINKNTVDIFLRESHHKNLSVLFLVQNAFSGNKGFRDISLNSHYFVWFNNPRERSQVQAFARQMEPNNSKYIVEAYKDSTSKPYGYLLFDMKQQTPNNMRLRTNIFPGETNYVYVPKRI